MVDKTVQSNETKTVTDEALKDVAGGATVQFESGAFDMHTGCKVRVINGSKCPTCGGTEGYVTIPHDNKSLIISTTPRVECAKCGDVILPQYMPTSVEVI